MRGRLCFYSVVSETILNNEAAFRDHPTQDIKNAKTFVVKNNPVACFLECAAIANRIESKIGPLLIGSNEAVIQNPIVAVAASSRIQVGGKTMEWFSCAGRRCVVGRAQLPGARGLAAGVGLACLGPG